MDKKAQTKRLYSLAAALGILERSNPDDNFHTLVHGMTGKIHVSELTAAEGKAVEAELQRQLNHQGDYTPKKSEVRERPNMLTKAQSRYIWKLIYLLMELDGKASSAKADERLAGAVRKILGITAFPDEPLAWVRREQASRLITTLEHYVRSAEKKAGRQVLKQKH